MPWKHPLQSSIKIRRLKPAVDLLALHEARPSRYPHLLESAAHGPHARFDILFAFPGDSLSLDRTGLYGPDGLVDTQDDFLTSFDRWWRQGRTGSTRLQEPTTSDGDSLPFRGGWFLYLGYELAAQIEPRLKLPACDDGLPVALATYFPAAVLRDRIRDELILVAEAEGEDWLEQMAADISALESTPAQPAANLNAGVITEQDPARYLAAVERILAYIHDGDVFQVNLSRPWDTRLSTHAADSCLYRRLREQNPGPFNGLASLPGGSLISSSPERLVCVQDGVVETRPIAGTRRRGQGVDEDEELWRELLAHPKEQAEHIMLLDLERNDLGRVCVPGSVEVNELMVLESYAHVHHIVSNVRGRLRPDTSPGAVIRATFPGGTITGCPKVRCMEIIAELEGEGRGAYTGSMGYVNHDGDMDLNILIRTMVHSRDGLRLRAGAGIVADSDARHELEETRAKARGLLLALANDRPRQQ